MSGFVGLLNLDGEPIDRVLLERLTQSLAFRGPDEQSIYCQGSLGLGHAMLRTTREASTERQPGALDDRLYIVADARIDARGELIEKLKAKCGTAHSLSQSTPDSELILHAYECWGEACVEQLLGDFSFAIWDARAKRLFCARDHFGVKPFFYAHVGSCIILSNTPDCVRMHPAVSDRLNDLAIADFLLFDGNQDYATTPYSDVRRLPAAHTLQCDRGTPAVRRYWSLSVTTPVHFQRDEEYIERFRELLDSAVADRLRTDSAGILMSGGLDSTIVAVSAHQTLIREGNSSGLSAYTQVFDGLVPHQERHYAKLAADRLGVPIEFMPGDGRRLFEFADDPNYLWNEPVNTAWPDSTIEHLRRIAKRSRIALTGMGGDPLLSARLTVHFWRLLKSRQFRRGWSDAARYLMTENRASRLYLRTRWRILFSSKRYSPIYPPWINLELEKALCLRERWEKLSRAVKSELAVRPEAQWATADPSWSAMFESFDAGATRVAIDVRHPFFDLRLVSFLLGLPRLPWCCDKEILREAVRGILPDAVRLRRKSPMPAEPLLALLARPDAAWVDGFEPTSELSKYVNRRRVPHVTATKELGVANMHLRPLSLNFWFANLPRGR